MFPFQPWRDEVADLRLYRESPAAATAEANRLQCVEEQLKEILRQAYAEF